MSGWYVVQRDFEYGRTLPCFNVDWDTNEEEEAWLDIDWDWCDYHSDHDRDPYYDDVSRALAEEWEQDPYDYLDNRYGSWAHAKGTADGTICDCCPCCCSHDEPNYDDWRRAFPGLAWDAPSPLPDAPEPRLGRRNPRRYW